MPTYEYECEACGHAYEREQRITEDPIKKCPACGKAKAKRLIGRGNFILKGGGWYSDLYSGPSNGKGGSSSASSETGAKSTASESKVASSSAD